MSGEPREGRSHEARPGLVPGCDQPHPGMLIECIDEREETLSGHHERMSETRGDNNGDGLLRGA